MAKARNIKRIRWLPGLLILAVLAAVIAACAPASSGPGSGDGSGGVDAGDVAPPFAMELLDGSQVTLRNLVDDEQPVFLMYFATWWPHCRAELQQLETFAANYNDAVDFYIVSFNEDANVIADYIAERGYAGPYIPAQPVGTMLADLEITRQSAMMALNAHGLILHRQTKGDALQWPAYLDLLTADPNAAPAAQDIEQQRQQRRQDLQLPSWWG